MNKQSMALTPPMGWNSWDCHGASVNEEQLLANARIMGEHLKAYGWAYVVCDIQWYEPTAGTTAREYIPFAQLTLDSHARLMPAVNRFPSATGGQGFAPIARQVHELGLKFGIHIMRGIPRQAAHARLPILGTSYTADQIASPFSICKWNSDMYGLDTSHPGAQAYYDSLFQLYAAWGVDYVKVDDICNTNIYPHAPYAAEKEIELIAHAVERCGRPMVLSLSPGPAVVEKAWHLSQHANLWRITNDFWDDWRLLKEMFWRCELWQDHVAPGCWPDCDMLPLGRIGMGHRVGRLTRFTRDEQLTMMTLWCIFRSPLMMGGSLPDSDAWTMGLLTHPEVLRLQQQGQHPRQVARDEGHAIWRSFDPDGTMAVALFNLGDEERRVSVTWNQLGLEGAYALRDLWQRAELGIAAGEMGFTLAPHAPALIKLTRT